MRAVWAVFGYLALALGSIGIVMPLFANRPIRAACRLLFCPLVGTPAPLVAEPPDLWPPDPQLAKLRRDQPQGEVAGHRLYPFRFQPVCRSGPWLERAGGAGSGPWPHHPVHLDKTRQLAPPRSRQNPAQVIQIIQIGIADAQQPTAIAAMIDADLHLQIGCQILLQYPCIGILFLPPHLSRF